MYCMLVPSPPSSFRSAEKPLNCSIKFLHHFFFIQNTFGLQVFALDCISRHTQRYKYDVYSTQEQLMILEG